MVSIRFSFFVFFSDCPDAQAVRNAADLSVMSCPVKYRKIGGFYRYYNGSRKAPFLTIFIAGNHEAAGHLWELYYGGWVAPNIYYLGASNIIRFGPLRIAGISGIFAEQDYTLPHHERLPFTPRDIKSFYHVRSFEVQKLLCVSSQVDVGLSHDWPRFIERYGDQDSLFKKKPFLKQESLNGELGSPAAKYVMDRLRPPYWFSAHMHIKFSALRKYQNEEGMVLYPSQDARVSNPDAIDLDDDTDENQDMETKLPPAILQDSPNLVSEPGCKIKDVEGIIADQPGQPVPVNITNKEVRFLSLSKCIPGQHYLQLLPLIPHDRKQLEMYPPILESSPIIHRRFELSYDPEWIAILRTFSPYMCNMFKGSDVESPAVYIPPVAELAQQVEKHLAWVEENLITGSKDNKLLVPDNFVLTASAYSEGTPEFVNEQPQEHTNPQTSAFCELIGVENYWDFSAEERSKRRRARSDLSNQSSWRGHRRGSGRGGGGRNRGYGYGRGRGSYR